MDNQLKDLKKHENKTFLNKINFLEQDKDMNSIKNNSK